MICGKKKNPFTPIAEKRRVAVLGGGFAGLFLARELRKEFDVVLIDAKEYFEYTPAILRVYAKPEHLDAVTFLYSEVLERQMGIKFILGEVLCVDGASRHVTVKPMWSTDVEEVTYDYCVIATGCSHNVLDKRGESLWSPTIHHDIREEHSAWAKFDERFLEGRRRHIAAEHKCLEQLNERGASVVVCGAGFIGAEWACELKHFFPKLKVAIVEFLPNCLGPFPKSAQDYCSAHMEKIGIGVHYNIKYDAKRFTFWDKIGMPNGADKTYSCMGVKAANYFMPKDTLSEKGPGGGGWILINKRLQVVTRNEDIWGHGDVFAIGDCNYGCVGSPADWKENRGLPGIPKIAYPAEEQAAQVARTIRIMDRQRYSTERPWCVPSVRDTWWPWGAGMFSVSLGPHDACFVMGHGTAKGSGWLCLWGPTAAIQKDLIETTKMSDCQNHLFGRCLCFRFLSMLSLARHFSRRFSSGATGKLACDAFYSQLANRGMDFFVGVPDSLLKDFCAYVSEKSTNHLISANEGTAVATAAGYYMATSKIPIVYLQNSGLGNCINPLLSLCDVNVYRIPMLLVIGWRGEPGVKDEPQHRVMGRVQNQMLDSMEVPYRELPTDEAEVTKVLQEAQEYMKTKGGPFCILVRKGTFTKYSVEPPKQAFPLCREEAMRCITDTAKRETKFIATTGFPGRELYELRPTIGDFYCVGNMGHASALAMGVAWGKPETPIICLDGDGANIMHMGQMAITPSLKSKLVHIVLNNGLHESVGGQPTRGQDVDFPAIARACGYRLVLGASTAEEVASAIKTAQEAEGPVFVEVKIRGETRSDLGRPKTSPEENKARFMRRLLEE